MGGDGRGRRDGGLGRGAYALLGYLVEYGRTTHKGKDVNNNICGSSSPLSWS